MEGDIASHVARGDLALVEARWAARRGADPAAPLGRAERIFSALARLHPQLVYAHDGLARCALERLPDSPGREARRPKRHGAARERRAGAGAQSQGAPALHPPGAARSLAGDPAKAKGTLEAAWAQSPLLRGSWESREAEEAIR